MATEKQKKVAQLLSENLRNSENKPLNKGEILKRAGYTEETSKRPSEIIESEGVQEELKPFLDQLIEKRQLMMDYLSGKKITNTKNAKDLTDMVDKFTKNIQLLDDKPTENRQILYWGEYGEEDED